MVRTVCGDRPMLVNDTSWKGRKEHVQFRGSQARLDGWKSWGYHDWSCLLPMQDSSVDL